MPSVERIKRLRESLNGETAVIYTPISRFYLTGFEAEDGVLIVTPDKALLAMDSRYIEAAQRADTGCEVLPFNKGFFEAAGVHEAAVETAVTFDEFAYLKRLMPKAALSPSKRLSDSIRDMRAVKDADELELMKTAQEITDAAFTHILGFIREGVTEREIALELEFFMRRQGADGVAFETIALSGKNGSMPHGVPSDKPVAKGELITMDFGAKYKGYCSDMTRTVSLGQPDELSAEIYSTVLTAHKAALETVSAGTACSVADAAAREVIASRGYSENFGHATGHGVGVEIHEEPRLSPTCTRQLAAGNVVTVEPGIYLPSKAGVRIEDTVVVTDSGCISLAHSEKELIKL